VRAAALCLALLLAPPAAAQDPASRPDRKPEKGEKGSKGDKPEKAPKPAAPEAAPPPDEIRVKADSQGGTTEHSWARGFVDVDLGPVRIQADALDFFRSRRDDGTTEQKAVFVGNVVFMSGENERITGERLTYDVDSGRGMFERATGYVKPGMLVEADSIERVDGDTYRVKGAKFTACTQPNPRWSFKSGSARIEVDDKVVGKNVVFKVKDVPAFYVPYIVYPIGDDNRSTGLLFPHLGYSSLRGFNVGEGFFWAMGRSFDQTFYADHYSKFGYGFGHEFRYRLDDPSAGYFTSYAFNPDGDGDWDYDLDWRAVQALPGKVRATVNVRRYSDILFQEQFQDSLNRASSRTENAQFAFSRNFRFLNSQLLLESRRTFFDTQTRINRRAPSLRVNRPGKKIPGLGLALGFDLRAENLERGNEVNLDTYSRYLADADVSYPISLSFLQVIPRVGGNYASYGASRVGNRVTGPGLDRHFFESSVEVQGPQFSRVFLNPSGFYTDKLKHVIGPEITWRYRTRIDDFDLIPKFDGLDQTLGTHQVDYALVQRILAKRPNAGGKPQPWEFLSWRLGQTYYVQIRDGQNEFDPNYSSSAFGPGGVPDHNSPLQSRLRIRPTQSLSGTFDLEYDVNFKQLRTMSIGTMLQGDRGTLLGNWSRALFLTEKEEERVTTRNFVRGAASFDLVPGRLLLEGGIDWDVQLQKVLQARGGLRYDVQCCGFTVEAIHYDYNTRQDNTVRFSIELANIGSIGNFMGNDPYGSGGSVTGGGAFR
jgi:LPS-assembly protein